MTDKTKKGGNTQQKRIKQAEEDVRETREMIKDVTQPKEPIAPPVVGEWTDSRLTRQMFFDILKRVTKPLPSQRGLKKTKTSA